MPITRWVNFGHRGDCHIIGICPAPVLDVADMPVFRDDFTCGWSNVHGHFAVIELNIAKRTRSANKAIVSNLS
jgi:hypothetical protein